MSVANDSRSPGQDWRQIIGRKSLDDFAAAFKKRFPKDEFAFHGINASYTFDAVLIAADAFKRGIDTIIERAAVAKATLYSAFGSKEELVRAYLEARHASRRAAVLAEMALHDDPRGKLLALFDVLVTTVKQPQFRGCAFANARLAASTSTSQASNE